MNKNEKAQPIKKGSIIERRRNRTVNVDVAHSEPKWFSVMTEANPPHVTGVIQNRKTGERIQRNRMSGHWEGVKTG